ncbi:MAG: ABC transporter substrate-binding protein [Burkholderiales bacterium]
MLDLQRRRWTIAAGVWVAAPIAALGQPARRFRVGFLFGSSREGVASEMATTLARLRELGYEEGRNLDVVARFADGQPARFPQLARELLEQGVEVVHVPNTQGAVELQKLSDRVAIIFVVPDPVGAGLVASLAHPGRNATGFTSGAPTIATKRVELLKDAFPSIRTLGVLIDRNFPVTRELALVNEAAQRLGIAVAVADASSREEYRAAVNRLLAAGTDAYYVVYTGSAFAMRKELAAAIRDTRLPAVYGQSRFADDGGLIAYSWQTLKVSVLAAEYVDRILRGTRPGDLPVQEPTVIELVVNLATARAQGLKIRESVLLRADRIVE